MRIFFGIRPGWLCAPRPSEAAPLTAEVVAGLDDLRDYVVEYLGDPGVVLVVDETGDVKKEPARSEPSASTPGLRSGRKRSGRGVCDLCRAGWARDDRS